LSYEKGIKVLLEAFKDNTYTLNIVGDGPLKNDLIEYVKKHNFENRINFFGHLSTDRVLEEVEKAKALILPSQTYENAPISILEALSLGKIVLGSNLGGIPEMVKNTENGFLFEPGDSKDINNAINKLESLTEKEQQDFSDYSLELVNTIYSKDYHLDRLLKIYGGKK
jgi:glycosyltransferase involved in cell wall biosynthesis